MDIDKLIYAVDRAAEQFEFYQQQHTAKVAAFEKSKSKDLPVTHEAWDRQIADTLQKAEVNRQMAEMCRDALKHPLGKVLEPISEDVRPEPDCDYEEVSPTHQGKKLQNYSFVNNLELGHLIVNAVAPHWSSTVRGAAANMVRHILGQKLTRMWDDVVSFHHKFKRDYSGPPRVLPEDMMDFRIKFMQEELDEYKRAWGDMWMYGDSLKLREDMLDALVDLVYVALGTAYLHGFNFAEAWRRVHKANMAKTISTNNKDSKRGNAALDVVKPPGWTPPNHQDLVGVVDDTMKPQVQGDLF